MNDFVRLASDRQFYPVTDEHDSGRKTRIKINAEWRPLVAGLLEPLTDPENWQYHPDFTSEEMAEWGQELMDDMYG